MFARVTIRVPDVPASARFYDTVLETTGYERTADEGGTIVWGDFAVAPAADGAFLLDPDGNSAEAVHHSNARAGHIDHLWFRVADVATARAHYLGIGQRAGFELRDDTPERAQFARPDEPGSFSVVAGEQPTEHVQMEFLDGTVAEVA